MNKRLHSITLNALFVLLTFWQTSPTKRTFSMGPHLSLLSSACYFFVFESLYFSASVANMLFSQEYLMVLCLRLGCKKKLAVFRWTNSSLDGPMLKNFCFQISAIIYRQQPLLKITAWLLKITVPLTALHEKEFSST